MGTRSHHTRNKKAAKKRVARKAQAPAKVKSTPAAIDADPIALTEEPGLVSRPQFTIAGIGASAGGFEAFSEIVGNLSGADLAIVFIQHVAPNHTSMLPELLPHAGFKVVQITDAMRVEPRHIYVGPPEVTVHIQQGRLHLIPRSSEHPFLPISSFFRSLAGELEMRAIGVVLSGNGFDGSAGLRDIKAVGGITIAQDPSTAKYDAMPRAAISTGAVDLVRGPAEIARELIELSQHPLPPQKERVAAADETIATDDQLRRIFPLLRKAAGIDFTHYKQPTIRRRLQRRMLLQRMANVERYIRMLTEEPAEARSLAQDILIHVTRFFRDPDSFQTLKELVFPKLIEQAETGVPIRIWVPGCATGEEAYSVAMTLLEFLGDTIDGTPVQIFATDISESAVETARAGYYPESISADVSPERLRRFFTRVDGNYRIAKRVRDLCIFARQDLTRDPPFSRLDLIMCRNVLIYLEQPLQRKLMTIFHYALKSTGFLMLAGSETIGANAELFALVEKKHKVYAKRANVTPAQLELGTADYTLGRPAVRAEAPDRVLQIRTEAQRFLIGKYAPPGVIVDREFQIVQFHGRTGPFLEPPPGEPSQNVVKMAREGLLHGLRSALHEAKKTAREVHATGLRVKSNGGFRPVDVRVIPLTGTGVPHFLVLFETPDQDDARDEPRSAKKKTARTKRTKPVQHGEITRLEGELAASRDYMQSIIQDLEAANEELQSANEEILSSNEELQSTNEELDTAKEELQSTNEELNTVNDELHARNEELSRANSDLLNLLGSVQIAVVIVSADLRIRRFTPMAEKVLNLIPSDIGRPISHIKPNIHCPDLEELVARVVDTVTVQECEVQDRQGFWYLLRIRPYKSVENKIEGAVLGLIDINAAKTGGHILNTAREYVECFIGALDQPAVVLDDAFVVLAANKQFVRTYGEADVGGSFAELSAGAWNVPELLALIGRVAHDGAGPRSTTIEREVSDDGQRRILVTAARIEGIEDTLILVTFAGVPK
jgi:two-component system, chemotaxis family, CheB/CheR fusion protein